MGKCKYDVNGKPMTYGQDWATFKKQYIKEVEEYLLLDNNFSVDNQANLNYLKCLDIHTRHNKVEKEFYEYLGFVSVLFVDEANKLVNEHIKLLEDKRDNSLNVKSGGVI